MVWVRCGSASMALHTMEQAEAVGLLQLAQGRSAEWQKASEQEVSEVRHEIASQVWP